MGCDREFSLEEVESGRFHIVGGEPMNRCPMALLRDAWTQEVVSLYRWWKRGQLQLRVPEPSGKVIAALDHLDYSQQIQEAKSRSTKGRADPWQ